MPDSKENVTEQTTTGDDMRMPTMQHSHIGPILGVLVIMLVIILGGLYLWGGMLSNGVGTRTPVINNEPETPRAQADQEIFGTVSTSDDLAAIEADINNTNFDSLQSDLVTIDAELNAAIGQ